MFADDEADRKKKKKTKAALEQVGLSVKSKFGPENADGIKKNNAVSKRVMQPEVPFLVMEKAAKDQKEVHTILTLFSNYSYICHLIVIRSLMVA